MRWSVPVKRMMKARTPGQIQMFFTSFVYLLHEKFHLVMISIRLFQVLTISPFILLIMTTAARPVFTDPSVFLDRLIAPGTTPVYSNKICVETIRHIAAGTSAYQTSRSGEVRSQSGDGNYPSYYDNFPIHDRSLCRNSIHYRNFPVTE